MLPDLKKEAGANYEKYDQGSIGQLDSRIIVEQYADAKTAARMAEAWKGGAYYAASNKDPKLTGTAKIGLMYLSRWDSDDMADQFAKIYADYLPKRYKTLRRSRRTDASCVDSNCKNSYFFDTEEGPLAVVRVTGAGVLVSESFEADLAGKIEQKLLLANPVSTVQVRMRSLMSPLRTSAAIQEAVGPLLAKRITEIMRDSVMHPPN